MRAKQIAKTNQARRFSRTIELDSIGLSMMQLPNSRLKARRTPQTWQIRLLPLESLMTWADSQKPISRNRWQTSGAELRA